MLLTNIGKEFKLKRKQLYYNVVKLSLCENCKFSEGRLFSYIQLLSRRVLDHINAIFLYIFNQCTTIFYQRGNVNPCCMCFIPLHCNRDAYFRLRVRRPAPTRILVGNNSPSVTMPIYTDNLKSIKNQKFASSWPPAL